MIFLQFGYQVSSNTAPIKVIFVCNSRMTRCLQKSKIRRFHWCMSVKHLHTKAQAHSTQQKYILCPSRDSSLLNESLSR